MIPNTKLISGVFKMFVKTGPGYDDCPTYHEIEVDLVLTGLLCPISPRPHGPPTNPKLTHLKAAN